MVTVSIFYIQFVVVQHVTIDGEQSRAILKVDLSYTFQLVVAICKRISWHDSQLKLILIYLVHPLSATGHTPSITKTHMLFVSWASCFVMGFFFLRSFFGTDWKNLASGRTKEQRQWHWLLSLQYVPMISGEHTLHTFP